MDQSYWSISDILADSARIPCSFNIDVPNLAHLAADASVLEQQQFQASQQSQQGKGQGRGNSDDAVNAAVTGTIKEKTKLELPFWLVELLALNDIVTPSLPRPYSQRVRNALNADANSVQLRSQSNWWYAVGMRLAELEMNRQAARSSRTDGSPLLDILSETYINRLTSVYSSAQHLASSSRGSLDGIDGRGSSQDGSSASGGSATIGGGGFGTRAGLSVGLSAEMIDFVNGLDESEKLALKRAHNSAAMMRIYLTGSR